MRSNNSIGGNTWKYLTLRIDVTCLNFRVPQPEKQSHVLDLLDVALGEASGPSVQTDPWGVPITAPPPRPQVTIPPTYY